MRRASVTVAVATLAVLAAALGALPPVRAEDGPGPPLLGGLTGDDLARRFAARQPTLDDFRMSQHLFDAVNLGASYEYPLERGEQGFVRQDDFVCTLEAGHLEAGLELSFVRVFGSAQAAAAAPAPSLDELPTTAARALAMRTGHVVSFTTRATVVARVSGALPDLAPGLGLRGRAGCMASGTFDLQVIRGGERFVHLRVLQRSEVVGGASVAVRAGVELFGQDVSGAVRLKHEAGAEMQVMAHYCVDLGSEAARSAFDRALSGRVRTREPGHLVHDLLGLDSLADEAADDHDPAVRRVCSTVARSTTRRQSVVFHVARFHAGFQRQWCRNFLTLGGDGASPDRHFLAALHTTRTSQSGLGDGLSERSSGILLHATADGKARSIGPHWFCWNRQSPPWHSFVPSSTTAEFANVLGPLASRVGVDRLLRPDRRQRRQSLQCVASSRAMEAFFDEHVTTAAVVGRALANMVRTMDVQFMLPYNAMPCTRGVQVDTTGCAELDEALETLGRSWGRWYAGYFRRCFMPRLLSAQRSGDVTARMNLLADLHDTGLGPNDFGGALLTRFLIEVLHVLGLADDEVYVAATMTYHVPAGSAEDPTALVTRGTVEHRAVFDTLWGLTWPRSFED